MTRTKNHSNLSKRWVFITRKMAAQSYLSYDGGSHWEDLDLWFLQNLQLERRRLSRKRVQISQVGAIQQGFVDLIGDCDDLGYYMTFSHANLLQDTNSFTDSWLLGFCRPSNENKGRNTLSTSRCCSKMFSRAVCKLAMGHVGYTSSHLSIDTKQQWTP